MRTDKRTRPAPNGGAPWRVEHARPTDGEGIARVHNSTWEHAYAHLLPPTFWDEKSLRHRIDNWTALLDRAAVEGALDRIVVGRSDGDVVGFATLRPAEEAELPSPELRALYVLPTFHGTGLGRALVEALLGAGPAHLWVAADNPRARAFYAKLGFAPDGTEKTDPALHDLREVRLVRGAGTMRTSAETSASDAAAPTHSAQAPIHSTQASIHSTQASTDRREDVA